MKKNFVIAMLVSCMTATALAGCGNEDAVSTSGSVSTSEVSNSSSAEEAVEEVVAASSSEEDEKTPLTEEDISVAITGIEDHYVLQDAEEISYLKNILYDSEIITEVSVDDSKVDLTTPGEYEITYHVMVDRHAYDTYTNATSPSETTETVSVITIISVVTREEATTLADAGDVVWGDKNVPCENSKGEAVEEKEPTVPKSSASKGTKPIVAETKEAYETADDSAEETEESEDEEKDTKNEEKTANSDNRSEESNNGSSNSSSGSTSSGSSSNTNSGGSSSTNNSNSSSGSSNGSSNSSNNGNGSSNNNSSNSNSGNSNSSTSTHSHNWVAVTQTVHHDAVTQTVHHDAVTHEEPVYELRSTGVRCKQCGSVYASMAELGAHYDVSLDCYSFETLLENVQTGTTTVVDQEAYDEVVVVQEAYDEVVTTGYKCSGCGATK